LEDQLEKPETGYVKQRSHLMGCLYDLSAEPTNNRAERSLRPAVIARKISCGNKTDRDRRTWQILASLAATCAQRGNDLVDYIMDNVPIKHGMKNRLNGYAPSERKT
jgi:hypothetical protein